MDELLLRYPKRTLNTISKENLPKSGVYFFFEADEIRHNLSPYRVVRIGTHAAIAKSKATLYKRLRQHRGKDNTIGNHRSSVFRKLVGQSLINKSKLNIPSWGIRQQGSSFARLSELSLEKSVSDYLYTLPFTILEVPGPSAKNNDRAFIEKNSIILLSNYDRKPINNYAEDWLGIYSQDEKIINSGLWNSKFVKWKEVESNYFEKFEHYLERMGYWSL